MKAVEQPPPQLRTRVLAAVATTRQAPLPAPSPRPTHNRDRLRRGSITAVAAAAAVFVLWQPAADLAHPQPDPIAAVLTAPDAEVQAVTSASGASASATVSREHAQLVVTAQHLPVLTSGHAYQVWLIGPRGVRSAGLLPTAGPDVLLATLPTDTNGLDITTEPTGGSTHPTTPNVVHLALN